MTVKAQKPIVIFRGDNTAAFDLRTIRILLTGDLDLSHATAKFTLLDFSKTWTEQEVSTGELSIVFTAEQTKAFALGPQTGTLRLYDMSTGTPRQLTIVNKIPFFVTNRVCEIDSQSYEADVCVSGENVIHIEFKVGARAVEGKADKVKNATTGDLASLTPDGNLEDSGIPKTDVLRKSQMDSTPTEGSSNPVTSDGIKQAIDAATPSDYAQVKAQVAANTGDIAEIESLIPAQASAQNQLADKQFVNSSIATNTANFLGTFDYTTDLGFPQPASSADVSDAAIATALASLAFPQTPTNNDYVFVQIDYSATTPADEFRRFKFNGTAWAYEYTLNNSSFTADQWAAINSGITSGAVAKLGALPTAQELATALAAKYEKPAGGIPASDLADGEQYHFYDAQVEYVYFGGNAHIQLPTSLIGTAKLEFEMGATYERTGDNQLIGVAFSANALFQLLPAYSSARMIFDVPTAYAGGFQRITGTPPTSGEYHEWKYRNGTFSVDDTVIGTFNNPSVAYGGIGYLGIFARYNHTSGTFVGQQKGRLYYLRIYDGSRLLVDLVPVRVGTAGCLYDKVSKRIYFPAGGTLSCGADVSTTLMAGKQDALTPQQLANIAAVPDKVDFVAIAPEFSTSSTYAVDDIVMYNGLRYRCTTAHTGAWNAANWTLEPVQTALDAKANASDLPYSIHAATVSSGTTPTVTNILARATNTATLGSTVTAATVTLPAATTGKMRDFYIALTVEGSTAPSLIWIDPATNTDADIAVGEDSLANINTGLNIVLFSEAAGQNRWIVSVKHEEAAS